MPQLGEPLQAFQQCCAPYRFGRGAAGQRAGGGHVGPVRELASIIERKVEQLCEHPRGEFDRDPIHPVESFGYGQVVENFGDSLADQRFEQQEVTRRNDRLRHLALVIVLRRIEGDEPGFHRKIGIRVTQHNASDGGE